MASISPMITDLIEDGISDLTIVSDSPTSQYRNRFMFYFMHSLVKQHDVRLKWIFLEAGHGKGIPDGVGASVKRAIQNIVTTNMNTPIYSVNDLMTHGLKSAHPSIKLY